MSEQSALVSEVCIHSSDSAPIKNHRQSMFDALVSLSRTQRRLAHEAKRQAMKAETEGNLDWYRRFRRDSERLWKEARWHLNRARIFKG